MLFKLLSDYGRGVAVAWDTRPVHRKEIAADYKADRRPMPDLLREQFMHFRPIVEAFGYQNLEFEGWEADDVIATLATLADEAGLKTCVVSTDRDAFQLVSENVCLMMTPRGVADVQVYTPERVEARYGIRPLQIPDFIGLKGDTSDNIPRIPRIGDKTAGQLIAQYGSLEAVVEHASRALARSLEGDRRERGTGPSLEAPRDDASRPRPRRRSCVARPAAPRPLRAQGDLPAVRVPRAARPRRRARRGAAGSGASGHRVGEGALAQGDLTGVRGRVGVAADVERIAVAPGTGEVIVARRAPATQRRSRARRHRSRREGPPPR